MTDQRFIGFRYVRKGLGIGDRQDGANNCGAVIMDLSLIIKPMQQSSSMRSNRSSHIVCLADGVGMSIVLFLFNARMSYARLTHT